MSESASLVSQPGSDGLSGPDARVARINTLGDELDDRQTGGAYRELARFILRLPEIEHLTTAPLCAKKKLLINMCGRGILFEEIEAHFRSTPALLPRIWQVDEKDAPGDDDDRVHFSVTSQGELGFPSNCFDYTVTIASPEHYEPGNSWVAETHRVLKPGGVSVYATASCIAYANGPSPPSFPNPASEFKFVGKHVNDLAAVIKGAVRPDKLAYERALTLPVHCAQHTPGLLLDHLMQRFTPLHASWNNEEKQRFLEGLERFMDQHAEWYRPQDHTAYFGIKFDAAVYICGKYRVLSISEPPFDEATPQSELEDAEKMFRMDS